MKDLIDDDTPLYSVTQVALQLNVHPQTLRTYDRKGIVSPQRKGRTKRLYTRNHLKRLQRLLALTAEGLNLPGAVKVMDLEDEVSRLKTLLQKMGHDPGPAPPHS